MTPAELLEWLRRQPEPAVPLVSIPDHDALGGLMDRNHAMAWQAPDGAMWAAAVKSERRRSRPTRTIPASEGSEQSPELDTMVSRAIEDADPAMVHHLAEVAGRLVVGWERAGNRRIPWPVILYLGRQAWPAEECEIRDGKAGSRVMRVRKGETCPGCKGGPLSGVTMCLICGRWGLDGLLPKVAVRPKRVKPKTIKFAPRGRKKEAG